MGASKGESDLVGSYFRCLQRNQLQNVKDTLEILRSYNGRFSPHENVVNTLKLVKSGDTSLHICARNGFLELIGYLVEEECANLELINLDGKTALHDAAQFSQLEVLNYLLSKGANVNVVKKADWTPLMLACTKDNLEIVESLVAAGADLNFVNKDGWTCIHIAGREGHVNILSFLLNSCDDLTLKERRSRNGRRAIHTAAFHGHLDAVKLLTIGSTIEQVNAEDNCGSSPLFDACRCGFQNIVEYFVEEVKLDPNLVNKNGVGLLHVAAEANQAEMIEFLVKRYQLDVDKPSHLLSFSPLHWASREGNLAAVKVLVSLGANKSVKDEKGRTAKYIATDYSKTEIHKIFEICELHQSPLPLLPEPQAS